MKRLFLFLILGVIFSFFIGCDLDKDNNSLNNAWVGFGLIHKDTINESFTINLDNDAVLYPATNSVAWSEVSDNERVLTNFTILGNKANTDNKEQYYVKINSLRKILYKGILDITPAIEDSIGNDPIKVKDNWIINNMLNFELQYPGGSKIHFINLVKQPGVLNIDNGPVVLELRHNNNSDPEQYPLSAIVTFDLSSLKIHGKTSTPIKIIAKGFDGDNFEFTGEYNY